jgi:hypothetical protein
MNDVDLSHLTLLKEGRDASLDPGVDGQIGNHLAYFLSVGPSRQGLILCSFQFGRRDHLHGPGNLCRTLDASDAPA